MTTPLTKAGTGFASFLNAPVQTDLANLRAHLAILGAPYGIPYGIQGVNSPVSLGPAAFRQASAKFGYGRFIEHWDFDLGGPLLDGKDISIVDCGDVAADPYDIPGSAERIHDATAAILDAGALPIVMGGDDSIVIPVFEAYEGRDPVTIIQIDAHIDWLDEIDGVTRGYSSPMRRASEMDWVEGLVQLGMRGVGSARREEVEDALASGATIITARQIHESGPKAILEQIPDGRNYLIYVDCDGLDPTEMPATPGALPGGPSYLQISSILQGLATKGRIAGMELVSSFPDRDVNGLTALVGTRLILNVIGAVARNGQLDI